MRFPQWCLCIYPCRSVLSVVNFFFVSSMQSCWWLPVVSAVDVFAGLLPLPPRQENPHKEINRTRSRFSLMSATFFTSGSLLSRLMSSVNG